MLKFHQIFLLSCLVAAVSSSINFNIPKDETTTEFDVTWVFSSHQPQFHVESITLKFWYEWNGERVNVDVPIQNANIGPHFTYTHRYNTHRHSIHQMPIYGGFRWEYTGANNQNDRNENHEIWLQQVWFRPVTHHWHYEVVYFPTAIQGVNEGISINLVRNYRFNFPSRDHHQQKHWSVNDWNVTVALSAHQTNYQNAYNGTFNFNFNQDHRQQNITVPFVRQHFGPNKYIHRQVRVAVRDSCQLPLYANFKSHVNVHRDDSTTPKVDLHLFALTPLHNQGKFSAVAVYYPNPRTHHHGESPNETLTVRSWWFFEDSNTHYCQYNA